MDNWYYKVCDDLGALPDFLDYYENELINAREEMNIRGKFIAKVASQLPAIVEIRYNQLQEIEAVLEYLNIKKAKKRSEKFRQYLEAYNRDLSSRDAEKYVEGDKEYYDICVLVNQVALLRNKFLGVHKGLDQASWQIGNITRLRCAGLDDATF